jgi:hypothetical protein
MPSDLRRKLAAIQQVRVHLNCGAPETNRTSDLPLRRGLLYPLSYRGVAA